MTQELVSSSTPAPHFFEVSSKDIVVKKDRGRQEFKKIQELAESIQKFGLIHPIVVSPLEDQPGKYELIAGERRFRACLFLGLAKVKVTFRDDLDDLSKKEIELEENLRRSDLTWTEQIVLVKQIDEIKRKQHGESRYSKDGWNTEKTADLLNTSKQTVSRQINLAKTLEERPDLKEKVKNLPMSVAMKVVKQTEERERVERLAKSKSFSPVQKIVNYDAYEGLKTMPAESVDLIITDPPFGTSTIDESEGKSRGGVQSYYQILKPDDNSTKEEVEDLLSRVIPEMYRILKPSSHIYIFYGTDFYEFLRQTMTKAGFIVEPIPLIWNKMRSTTIFHGYSYTSCYEPILFAHKPPREKRLAEAAKSILDFSPVSSQKKIHPFEKPQELLTFLIKQSSNMKDTVFDPFAGSGATIKAAVDAGRHGAGFEKNPDHYKLAIGRLNGLLGES